MFYSSFRNFPAPAPQSQLITAGSLTQGTAINELTKSLGCSLAKGKTESVVPFHGDELKMRIELEFTSSWIRGSVMPLLNWRVRHRKHKRWRQCRESMMGRQQHWGWATAHSYRTCTTHISGNSSSELIGKLCKNGKPGCAHSVVNLEQEEVRKSSPEIPRVTLELPDILRCTFLKAYSIELSDRLPWTSFTIKPSTT